MRRLLTRFARATGGATAVEFAMVVGPLLLLVFGTVEYARMLWMSSALQSTANAGARCMGIMQLECADGGSLSEANAVAFVVEKGTGLQVAITAGDVAVDPNATCAGVGGFSQVTISYTFTTPLPVLFGSMADGVPLSATACFPNQVI